MQFRKQRLALWAASRVPDPSFTAMVFEPCDRVLGPERKGSQSQGLEPVSIAVQKATFGPFGTMGCQPRARSVLQWHGV